MSKFNCAREYQLSKRRYDGVNIFHHDPSPHGFGFGTVMLITASIVVGLLMFGWMERLDARLSEEKREGLAWR